MSDCIENIRERLKVNEWFHFLFQTIQIDLFHIRQVNLLINYQMKRFTGERKREKNAYQQEKKNKDKWRGTPLFNRTVMNQLHYPFCLWIKTHEEEKKNNNAHIYPCLLFLSSLRSKNTCDLCRGLIVISDYAVNKRHHRRIDLWITFPFTLQWLFRLKSSNKSNCICQFFLSPIVDILVRKMH